MREPDGCVIAFIVCAVLAITGTVGSAIGGAFEASHHYDYPNYKLDACLEGGVYSRAYCLDKFNNEETYMKEEGCE